MNTRRLVMLAVIGFLVGVAAALYYSRQEHPQPPAFKPAENPYSNGIFANGIIESLQGSGENTQLYPEVSGVVTQVLVKEGQVVRAGDPLVRLEDSVQQGVVEQLRAQVAAARANVELLSHEPRPEVLAVTKAQLASAEAAAQLAVAQYQKRQKAYEMDPAAVSRDTLDTFNDSARVAQRNLDVAQKQFELTQAGAWRYEIDAQKGNLAALEGQLKSAEALLGKYTLRATTSARVLRINAGVNTSVSPSGVYDPYTQAMTPVVSLGKTDEQLAVRVFVDEILLSRLPTQNHMEAQLHVRGTDIQIPLEFVRVQPYVTPKIQLSDQRTEQVDLRVLPVVFQFKQPPTRRLYPGQLVDVYIKSEAP